MAEYTTTGPAAPTTDGADEALIEESPLPAGAGDAEVEDDIDDKTWMPTTTTMHLSASAA
jgi:hypothetical protein